jgi:phosphoenolpyruvate carboxykinase (ATP)
MSLLQCRIRVRVVTARAYHCLFMHNMLLRASEAELASFGRPDFTNFNAGGFPANRFTSYMTSSSSVNINLKVNRFNTHSAPSRDSLKAPACLRLL